MLRVLLSPARRPHAVARLCRYARASMVVRCISIASASLVAILGLFALPPRARAYERSTVGSDPSTALFWRHRTVPVRPAYDTSEDLGRDEVGAAIARSIGAWNLAGGDCSDFALRDDGYPSGHSTNLDGGDGDGENRIVFRELVWPEDVSAETLALTTLVYRRSTGEILDADIDLNAVDHRFTITDDTALADTDVENTVTHELGHLLGLSHVLDLEATMYGQSEPGDLAKRSLEADDVAGLCAIYPRGLRSPGAPLLPGAPLTGGCAIARGVPLRGRGLGGRALGGRALGGRALGRRALGRRAPLGLALLVAGLLALTRRRRTRAALR